MSEYGGPPEPIKPILKQIFDGGGLIDPVPTWIGLICRRDVISSVILKISCPMISCLVTQFKFNVHEVSVLATCTIFSPLFRKIARC